MNYCKSPLNVFCVVEVKKLEKKRSYFEKETLHFILGKSGGGEALFSLTQMEKFFEYGEISRSSRMYTRYILRLEYLIRLKN